MEACRSVSPDGDHCTKGRGHKKRLHQRDGALGFPPSKKWEDGINKPAKWEYIDDGYMTEADWDIRFRYGI